MITSCDIDEVTEVSRVQSSVRARPPYTKEVFVIIPTHMMNSEIIQGRKKRVRLCLL